MGTHRAPKIDPRHLAPREPVPLARNAVAVGIAASSVTGPIVLAATPAAADQVATSPIAGLIPAPRLAVEEVSSPVATTTTYKVVVGDWLSKIAPRVGEDWHELYEDNVDVVGADPNLIFPGQILRVPSVQGPSVPTQPIPTVPAVPSQTAPRHAAPYQAPLTQMNVTQPFKGAAHQGVDLAAKIGTPGYAVADGTVLFSRPAHGFGLWTVIRSQIDGQTVDFVYGHMDHLIVSEGDHVSVGDHIIDTGTNGIVTGPHLHFEVWIGGRLLGHPVDPIAWLMDHGVAVG